MKLVFIYTAILTALFLYMVFGYNGLLTEREISAINLKYELLLVDYENQITALERELELLKNDKDYQEYLIKRDLGLQMNTEELYLIPDE